MKKAIKYAFFPIVKYAHKGSSVDTCDRKSLPYVLLENERHEEGEEPVRELSGMLGEKYAEQ